MTFVPHDDVNQVNGSETGEKTEKRNIGESQKRIDYNDDDNES